MGEDPEGEDSVKWRKEENGVLEEISRKEWSTESTGEGWPEDS